MSTVSRLARRHGLSRSTLLYYERIGLLRASRRTEAGYRVYDDADERRLERICGFRAAGLPLADVARLLDDEQGAGPPTDILERHLAALNAEIARLREQQRDVLALLGDRAHFTGARSLDKQQWVAVLRAAGMDDAACDRWHTEFERLSPEAHQDFMESLGIGPAEIREIRRECRRALSERR